MPAMSAVSDHRDGVSEFEAEPGLVLVVDDEPLLLRSLRRILVGAGHRVEVAENPDTATPLAF